MSRKKGQTATEYLIILAVVIIIALIVVGVLGGIPGIGGNTGNSIDALNAQTQEVGIDSVVTTLYGTSFIIRNNQDSSIQLWNITINDASCFTFSHTFDSGTNCADCGYVPAMPQTIGAGKTLEVTCQAFRYSADTSQATLCANSDSVYADCSASDDNAALDSLFSSYKGSFLLGKSIGDQLDLQVSFQYQDLDTSAYYTTSAVSLTSTIAGGVGYS